MRRIAIGVFAVLLAVSAFVGVGFAIYGNKTDPASIERADIKKVTKAIFSFYGNKTDVAYITAPIKRGSIEKIINAIGTVHPIDMVEVGSELSGQVTKVLVNFNDPVKANQVIAVINPEHYIAGVTAAEAELNIAMASAQEQKAALDRAKITEKENERNYKRNIGLAKTKAIAERDFTASRALFNTSVADVSMAEAKLASAEAVVEQKRASLQQAKVDLQRTEIRAPRSGVVIDRLINPGQTVAVSLVSKTLFKIADDLKEMQVYGKIDEADIGQIKVGQRATFTVDAYPNKIFSGRVLQVRKSPEVSQNVVTYTAVVSAPNPDLLLFPGMTARLQIIVAEAKDTLKIPNVALQFHPNTDAPGGEKSSGFGTGSTTVWIVDNAGKALPVPVTIGTSDEFSAQLLSGNLRDGDRVIVGLAKTAGETSHD
jgi:HlyD family secretion protein